MNVIRFLLAFAQKCIATWRVPSETSYGIIMNSPIDFHKHVQRTYFYRLVAEKSIVCRGVNDDSGNGTN